METRMMDRVWVTREGIRYRVSAMETRHIFNCLRMMDRARARGRRWREEYRDRLELELEIRAMRSRT